MKSEIKNRALKKRNQKLTAENNELKKMHFHVREEKLELSLSKHDHSHTHNVTISDLPSPDILAAYPSELQALILERIKTDIDNDKALVSLEKDEQKLRVLESKGELKLKSRGQIFAFSALLILVGAAIYFAEKDAYGIAGSIVAVTIVGSITAFTGFNPLRRKSKRTEDESIEEEKTH